MSIWANVPSYVGAVGGVAGFGTLLRLHMDKRVLVAQESDLEADAAQKVSSSAMMLLEPLSAELAKTRAEAEALRRDVASLRAYVATLMAIIHGAGLPLPPLQKGPTP